MIPLNGWKPMEDAPKNGETLMARYHPRDVVEGKFLDTWLVHAVQWLCDERGKNWQWSLPGRQGATAFALGWMTFAEFQEAQARESSAQQKVFDL